jgi:hypothetical protein
MRRLASVALVACLCLADAASASASSEVVMRVERSFLGTVALAGDRVLATNSYWSALGASSRVFSAVPGKRPAVLARAVPSPSHQFFFDIAGSRSQVLVRRQGGGSVLMAGPPAGPLHEAGTCSGSGIQAIDRDLSAWTCDPSSLVVHLGPYRTMLGIGDIGQVFWLDVAGRFVAWISVADAPGSRPRLTVYDTATGGAIYHVDDIPPVAGLALESNGTAVTMSYADVPATTGCPFEYARFVGFTYYTTVEPFAHDSPVRGCATDFRVSNGRLAYVRPAGGHAGVLALADLADGGHGTDVAQLEHTRYFQYDFDGRRVAWVRSRCLDDVVEWRSAADRSPPERSQTCPMKVGRPRVNRHGALSLPISCPRGCSSIPAVRLEYEQPDGIHVTAPDWISRRLVNFRIPAGGRQLVDMHLTRAERMRLHRERPERISFAIYGRNVSMQPSLRVAYSRR